MLRLFKQFPKAFTLLEMMVALAILTVLVILLAAIYQHVDRIAAQAAARQQRDQTARVAFQAITRELQQINLPPPSLRTVAVAGNRGDIATNARSLPLALQADSASLAASNAISGNSVYWPASLASTNETQSVAFLGYFVRWIKDQDRVRPVLCRLQATDTNFSALQNTNALLSAATLNQFAPADETSGFRGWFVENVLAIWVRALDSRGNPITQAPIVINGVVSVTSTNLYGNFDSSQGFQTVTGTQTNRAFAPALPASLEVALVIAEDRALKNNTVIHSVPANLTTNSQAFWTNINTYLTQVQAADARLGKSLRVYSTRIGLPATSP